MRKQANAQATNTTTHERQGVTGACLNWPHPQGRNHLRMTTRTNMDNSRHTGVAPQPASPQKALPQCGQPKGSPPQGQPYYAPPPTTRRRAPHDSSHCSEERERLGLSPGRASRSYIPSKGTHVPAQGYTARPLPLICSSKSTRRNSALKQTGPSIPRHTNPREPLAHAQHQGRREPAFPTAVGHRQEVRYIVQPPTSAPPSVGAPAPVHAQSSGAATEGRGPRHRHGVRPFHLTEPGARPPQTDPQDSARQTG